MARGRDRPPKAGSRENAKKAKKCIEKYGNIEILKRPRNQQNLEQGGGACNVLIQRGGGILGSFFRPSATGEDKTVVSSSFRKAREFSETPLPPRIYGEASILRQNASLPHHSFSMRIQRGGVTGGTGQSYRRPR